VKQVFGLLFLHGCIGPGEDRFRFSGGMLTERTEELPVEMVFRFRVDHAFGCDELRRLRGILEGALHGGEKAFRFVANDLTPRRGDCRVQPQLIEDAAKNCHVVLRLAEVFRPLVAEGVSRFVKFHWKPLLGVHSVAWDEAQKISGKDPDYLRRDLWDAIEQGNYPEWELGVQVVDESREDEFAFDLLDPTKLIPEELVPVERIGRLVLNRNPDNFFAETEQVAFHPGHIVPGIDFTNDPLLQGRLFSYTDTQLKRLGGPNFHEIPINRPIAPVHNNQRDGHMRQTINRGKVSYEPNSIGGNCPMQASSLQRGFTTYAERLAGTKIRARSEKFFDHFSQATLFVQSQSAPEKDHMVEALRFELGKVQRLPIRERMVGLLSRIDEELATRVAEGLGMEEIPPVAPPLNHSIPGDGDPAAFQPRPVAASIGTSPALSMANTVFDTVATRLVAILAADGVDMVSLRAVKDAIEQRGAAAKIVAPRLGTLKGDDGDAVLIDFSLLTAASVLFDAVFVPGGAASVRTLMQERDAIEFVTEAYRHCKPIGALDEGRDLLKACPGVLAPGAKDEEGVVTSQGRASELAERFLAALARHRFWTRGRKNRVDATPADDTRGRAVP
jgi:catalase